MKIQIGKIFLNKTTKYLTPCLAEYGLDFKNKLDAVTKLAIGIGDMVLVDKNVLLEKHIFILVDTKANPTSFINFLNYIKSQSYYEDDYVFDDVSKGRKHMIVISIPDKYTRTIHKFKENKYSEMYSEEEVEKLFANKPIKKVFIKDHNYKVEFVKEINSTYNMTGKHKLKVEEWDGELDFPIDLKEEIFNNDE